MSTPEVGSLERLSAEFRDVATNDHIDPSAVFLSVTDPTGFASAKTPVRDTLGHYHFDLNVTLAGQWLYRWYATGTGQSAVSGSFFAN